jgi:hypothetical protein
MVTNLVTVTPSRDPVLKAGCAFAASPSIVSKLVPSSFPALFVGIHLQDSEGHWDDQKYVEVF